MSVIAPPATGILDPRTGRPAGADDASFVTLNNELADKGFLVTATDDLINWARNRVRRGDDAERSWLQTVIGALAADMYDRPA